MFLFLSKLLPLFVYPLGLSCLLLVLALAWLRRRPRRASGAIALALIILLASSNGWVAAYLTRSLEWRHLPIADIPSAQAIVVLGGGILPADPPRPWVEMTDAGDRVLYGSRLYLAGKAPLLILSGGRITWREGGASESADMAEIAESMGAPPEAIVQDPTSLNTYQNAVNVKQILQERGLNQIILVTSALHMPRSLLIFEKQGIEVIPAATDFSVSEKNLKAIASTPQARALNLIPDARNLNQVSKVMKEYIGLGVYRLRGWL
ncbi:MAG: YdcF family protein [Leptolyngbyaceae cyanobacterium MO_188.B28]|nr:YdcF family protein [Leptolyngbyaceae cyanobacterium MO_188.B28]